MTNLKNFSRYTNCDVAPSKGHDCTLWCIKQGEARRRRGNKETGGVGAGGIISYPIRDYRSMYNRLRIF